MQKEYITRSKCPEVINYALADGLNHLQIYVFWNIHEPNYDFSDKHVYNYEGLTNITQFLEYAKDIGIFINLRIGPYVCAEWSFGGVPTVQSLSILAHKIYVLEEV